MEMPYNLACAILRNQERQLRQIRNVRMFRDGYEYRVDYRGGFANYIAIDRRRIGKRRFEYFGGVGAYDCRDAEDAMKLVVGEIERKTQRRSR